MRSRSSSAAWRWRRTRRIGTTTWASSSSPTAGWRPQSTPTVARSPSTRATQMPTATWACCWKATGKPAEAEAAYRTAIRLNPEHIEAYANLGILLNGLQRTEEAAACYCKVITLMPRHREARRLLALAHCTLGEIDQAVGVLETWLAEEPRDPIALHMLAACTGRDVPARASNEFVARTFDSFAASFEAKLERLKYRAPALVAAMLADFGSRGVEAPPRAGCRLRDGTVRPAPGPVCAPPGRRGPLRRDVGACEGEERL